MLKLTDITKDTYTNAGGQVLYLALKPYLASNIPIELSFTNASPTSSSFLNSSFGELINLYGLHQVRACIRITNISGGEAQLLKKYFSGFQEMVN